MLVTVEHDQLCSRKVRHQDHALTLWVDVACCMRMTRVLALFAFIQMADIVLQRRS